MVYQGSKNRIAKYLVPIIEQEMKDYNLEIYAEPMCGGCNLIDKVNAPYRIASDSNEYLIALLKAVQADPEIKFAPSEVTKEHYADVRANQFTGKYSKEYVALVGYCASYGGRYFDGGYGRDNKGGRSIYIERLKNLKAQAPSLKGIALWNMDYKSFPYTINGLYYFDPPYKGTKAYNGKGFNHEEFYNFLRNLHKQGIHFLVSEYSMPDDFKCIGELQVAVLQKSDRIKGERATEKLFTM